MVSISCQFSSNTPKVRTHTKRKIILAKAAGFCFGVRRAVEITLQERGKCTGTISTLGPIVHNAQVAEHLSRHGVGEMNSLDMVTEGTVVISAHGVAPNIPILAKAKGLQVIDATCPFVSKVHRSARTLFEQGYPILLVGDLGHTEVAGVVGAIEALGGSVRVVTCPADVEKLELGRKVGIISQTTQYSSTFADVVAAVCRRVQDVRAINTVCGATEELQSAAAEMANQVEVAIVIGGVKSANTRRLREICASTGIPAYQIEKAKDIQEEWLHGKGAIGLTAGASTPDWIIEDVARRLNYGQLPDNWVLAHPED